MLTNKTIATAVVTALVGQAAAFNSHRHLHREVEKNLDKRALETDWVTAWQTVYVTAGQEPEPTPEAKAEAKKPEDKVAPPAAPEPTTSIVVVEPSQPPAPVAQEDTVQPPPAQPTTFATQVKKPEPSPEPVVDVDVGAPVVENPVKPSKTKQVDTPKPSGGSGDSAPSGDAPFSSKRGLAYNDALLANVFGSSCEACSWAWNWGSSSAGLKDLNFVPMLWGDLTEHTDHWDEDCKAAIKSGSKAILSFNEPDHGEQATMGAADAAAAHATWMNKYSGDVLIGSPSVTNSGKPGEGLEYLQAFMDACDTQEGGCAIDFCQVHWYSEAAYADTLYQHIEDAHKICHNKPIWLTEFAPLDTDPAVIDDFMKTVIPELEKIEYLDAYSYFMVSLDNLMSSSSALSTFGELYASV